MNKLNGFEMLNEFEIMNTTLKTVLRTCEKVSIKPCMNREDNIKISQSIYSIIVVARAMKFLSAVTPTYIYHG